MVMAAPISLSLPPGRQIRVGLEAPALVRRLVLAHRDMAGIECRVYRPNKHVHERLEAGAERLATLAAHDEDPEPPRRLSRQRVADGAVQRHVHFLPDDEHALALSSRVETVQGLRHLLLLDFAVPASDAALADVVRACELHGWSGAVLASGSSYHFMGFEPLTLERWLSAMGHALLLTDLIDVRYMGHALARGAGALRLCASAGKPTVPVVVALVGVGA